MQSLAVQKFGQFVYREKSADVVEKFVFRATAVYTLQSKTYNLKHKTYNWS